MEDTGTNKKELRFTKNCKLASCKKVFHTNREWQDFCEPKHQVEHWRILRRSEGQILKKITALEKENKRIREKLGIKD